MPGRIVALLGGSLLLFASLMKSTALIDSQVTPGQISSDWWLLLAITSFELFLGVWLIVGTFPVTARWTALVLFVGFTGVTLYKAVRGEASCGCLGSLAVNPWYTATFDALFVVALWLAWPKSRRETRRWEGVAVLAGTVVLVVGLGMTIYDRATTLSRDLVVLGAAAHEFGEVGQSEELTYSFAVQNLSAYPVEVVSTKTTCGCTTVEGIDGERVEPSSILHIPITLNTNDAEEYLTGTVTLFCRRVGSQDPPSLFRRLRVSAKVHPDYWVRPLIQDLGRIDHDGPVTGIIRFRPNRMPNARITRVEATHPAFSAKVLQGLTPESDQQIEVTFQGKAITSLGRLETVVIIHTNSPRRETVTALVQVDFTTPLSVKPQFIVVGTDLSGEVVRDVTVKAVRPIRLEDVRITSNNGEVEVTEVTTKEHRLRVTLPDVTGPAELNAWLRFKVFPQESSAANEARSLEIPIHRLRNTISGDV